MAKVRYLVESFIFKLAQERRDIQVLVGSGSPDRDDPAGVPYQQAQRERAEPFPEPGTLAPRQLPWLTGPPDHLTRTWSHCKAISSRWQGTVPHLRERDEAPSLALRLATA